MPNQDGLRFLFDIQDKITAKVAKIEARAIKSAAKIDKAFTRASKSQQINTSKAIASEQRRVVAVEKSHAKAVKLLQRESNVHEKAMQRLAAASAVAFAAVAGKAIQMAGGYDQAMRSVQAKTGATGALMDRLSEQSREMGRTTVHSATEAARGQAFLAQAGFDTNEILEALPATLALATAGELDLASAADIASNVLSGFRLETIETGRVTDVLAAIAARTNTSVSQMGEALSKAAPAAAAAGWSLEQTAAAIGRLSDAGIQGEEAGTVLKTMLARLAAPTGKLAALMTATGISVTDTTGKMLPLNDIIAQLAPHADNTGLMFELLGTRGANAGLILGSLGDDDLANLTAELENSEGAAQTMADTMSGGLWGAIKSIQSIVESAYISFGERFGPAVKGVAKIFQALPSPIQEAVVVIGSLAAAMGGLAVMMPQAFGSLTNLPGKLGKVIASFRTLNLTMLANPIGLVVAAVALLAGGLYLLFTKTEIGRQAFRAYANIAKAVFATAINVARVAIEFLAKWAGIAKDKIVAMIPKWVVKSVEWLGEKVAVVTGDIRDFNERMEASATHTETASESYEDLADATTMVVNETGLLPPVITEAGEAIADTVDEVQALIDTWTGATLKSDEFLAAFEALTPEMRENDRIMDQVLAKYESMRRVLGPFNAELEALREAAERLKHPFSEMVPVLVSVEDGIGSLSDAVGALAFNTTALEQQLVPAAQGLAALGQTVGTMATPVFAVAGKESSTAFLNGITDTFAGAFAGGGGFMGGLQSVMTQGWGKLFVGEGETAATGFLGKMQGVMGALGGVPLVGPLLAAFGPALLAGIGKLAGKVWSAIKGIFGASEAQLAAREAFAGFHDSAVEALGDTQRFADEVQVAINAGWDRTLAETRAGFVLMGQDMGKTYDQAFSDYERYQQAVHDGNTELMAKIEKEYGEWERIAAETATANTAASEESTESIVHDAAEIGAQFKGLTAEEAAQLGDALIGLGSKANQAFTDIHDSAKATGAALANKLLPEIKAVSRAIRDMPRDITIRQSFVASEAPAPGRQHGGPVSAGRRYRVGEAGPEWFVPSQSGRIEPHGSSGGGVDAKVLAKAVADALQGTRVDVDGRQLGRLVVRHQPLAAAELGGRR